MTPATAAVVSLLRRRRTTAITDVVALDGSIEAEPQRQSLRRKLTKRMSALSRRKTAPDVSAPQHKSSASTATVDDDDDDDTDAGGRGRTRAQAPNLCSMLEILIHFSLSVCSANVADIQRAVFLLTREDAEALRLLTEKLLPGLSPAVAGTFSVKEQQPTVSAQEIVSLFIAHVRDRDSAEEITSSRASARSALSQSTEEALNNRPDAPCVPSTPTTLLLEPSDLDNVDGRSDAGAPPSKPLLDEPETLKAYRRSCSDGMLRVPSDGKSPKAKARGSVFSVVPSGPTASQPKDSIVCQAARPHEANPQEAEVSELVAALRKRADDNNFEKVGDIEWTMDGCPRPLDGGVSKRSLASGLARKYERRALNKDQQLLAQGVGAVWLSQVSQPGARRADSLLGYVFASFLPPRGERRRKRQPRGRHDTIDSLEGSYQALSTSTVTTSVLLDAARYGMGSEADVGRFGLASRSLPMSEFDAGSRSAALSSEECADRAAARAKGIEAAFDNMLDFMSGSGSEQEAIRPSKAKAAGPQGVSVIDEGSAPGKDDAALNAEDRWLKRREEKMKKRQGKGDGTYGAMMRAGRLPGRELQAA